ncbi:gamma-glutamylcyclotransferase [Microvirga sp. W0021]|uniref:glutathione-specific gamma-glutamylcyclotransferase n=1 Tax=Hohaiivirga grylli TaxID=3133970 RepID=A0ABV0BLS2_9HYPH
MHQTEEAEIPSQQDDLWVFGYGSLMWRPGFEFIEKHIAQLENFHRSFCILSHVHRGTPEKPGLVLGLDHGGSCTGIAYKVKAQNRTETIAYLREREQVTSVYLERWLPARLASGEEVKVLAYIVDRDHKQYSGTLSNTEKLTFIKQGNGISGPNSEYVRSTYEHLRQIDIEDHDLAQLVADL